MPSSLNKDFIIIIIVCIWFASSHSEMDYICKTKFIFHAKCTLSSKTWFNGAKPGFATSQVLRAKPGYCGEKPGFAIDIQSQNLVFLDKPGLCLVIIGFTAKPSITEKITCFLQRKTWFCY